MFEGFAGFGVTPHQFGMVERGVGVPEAVCQVVRVGREDGVATDRRDPVTVAGGGEGRVVKLGPVVWSVNTAANKLAKKNFCKI